MYEAAVTLFYNTFVPVRNFYYRGHAHHQGDSYFSRFMYDQTASWLFRRMGAGDVLSRDQQFVPYQLLYNLRPDGQQMRRGDTFDHSGRADAGKIEDSKRFCFQLAGDYYEDPYLLWAGESDLFYDLGAFERVFQLLFRRPGLRGKPPTDLPLTKYFAEPIGDITMRTGWTLGPNSRDALIDMRIGQYFFGNHQRKDFGTFQVYYRGALAISSGLYARYGSDHWKFYYHPTISHNGLLVLDPNEGGRVSDGGQRWPQGSDHPVDLETMLKEDYQMGDVTAHEFGPDKRAPEYSYLSGDITKAYSDKVTKVTRSMVALNTGNSTYPAAFIVFDRVHSSKPEFKKTWLLHTIQEPEVFRRSFSVVRDESPYGGRLFVESLLPAEADVTKVGGPGKEFWVEPLGKNFPPVRPGPAAAEPGAWRIEVSPARPALGDRFLHAMAVADAETRTRPPVRLVRAGKALGASVLDWTVLFSDGGEALTELEVRASEAGKILVCDAAPGEWDFQSAGAAGIMKLTASTQGQCLQFRAAPGTHRLSHRTSR
jgi:heparin/heparan-sulfate lyase